jgi:hypothetical protein
MVQGNNTTFLSIPKSVRVDVIQLRLVDELSVFPHCTYKSRDLRGA